MSKIQAPKLYIINTSSEPNNVIFGHADFARAAGMEPVFVFPHRVGEEKYDSIYSGYQIVRLKFTFETISGFAYLWSIMLLLLHVTWIFSFKRDARDFLAIDLTGTIACLFLKLRGVRVHTLVNDNFSARYDVSPFFYRVLRAIESAVFRVVSTTCIFPDESRYVLLGSPSLKRVYYIPNVLTDEYAPRYEGSNSDKLVVMFCGWLAASRGIELLSDLLKHTSENIEFLLVGSGDEEKLTSLAGNKRVKYIDHVSRRKNLEFMAKVDINIAFYSPRILINRFALPQKIYDSLLISCPLFVNAEVQMAMPLQKSGSCFSAEYFDILAIANKLNELVHDKVQLIEMSKAMDSYSAEFANFQKIRLAGIDMYRDIVKLNPKK